MVVCPRGWWVGRQRKRRGNDRGILVIRKISEGNATDTMSNAFKHAGVNVFFNQDDEDLTEMTAGIYKEETFCFSAKKMTIVKNSSVAEGIVSEPPVDLDDGIKSIKDNRGDNDDDFHSIASYSSSTMPFTNIIVSGIIGTDKMGNTYSPQKFIYVYDKNNKKHHEIAMESISNGVQEWNAKEGCSANAFTFTMKDTNFPVITALSGVSRGFMAGTINEFKPPVDPEKKKKVQKDDVGAKIDGK